MNTFTIQEFQLPIVEERIIKLNKKAEKLGIAPIEIVSKVERVEKIVKENRVGVKIVSFKHLIDITLKSETIKVGNYTFIGTIDHNEGNGNLIRTVPGEIIPDKYRTAGCNCDHCNIKRYRSETFLFRDTLDSEVKQIGRTCLKEYFGIDPIKELEFAGLFSSIGNIDDDDESTSSKYYTESTKTVLMVAMALADERGYVSNKSARERECFSTSDLIPSIMYPFGINDQQMAEKIWDKIDKENYSEKADNLISWGIEHFKGENSDYAHNMSVLLASKEINPKNYGYLTSLIGAHFMEVEKNKTKIPSNNEFIGSVGGKVSVDVKVDKVIPIIGYYGTSYINIMVEKDTGNALVWISSKQALEEGFEGTVKGTIKEHNVRNGVNQTVLTRCKSI